jgi:hypothetical protein
MGAMSRDGDLEMTPGAERGERFVGLIVCALSSCSGCCFSSSVVDFSIAVRRRRVSGYISRV